MHGFLVVDKPAGITSHDVVARVRRLIGNRQVGHTGTLDPFATGVLVVACGAATKAIPYLHEEFKSYHALLILGESTDTQDCTGTVTARRSPSAVDVAEFTRQAAAMVGIAEQVPPMYSAVKQGGVPLYRLARSGQDVERTSRQIVVDALSVERFDLPEVEITVRCSKGTYVRTLAHDLGERLGCGAHLRQLRRLASGTFSLEQSVSLALLQEMAAEKLAFPWVSINVALSHLPAVTLSQRAADKALQGLVSHELLATPGLVTGRCRLLTPCGVLVAIAEFVGEVEGTLTGRLLRVFPELSALQG